MISFREPTHAQNNSSSELLTQLIFKREGVLCQGMGLEHRQQQEELARRISFAIDKCHTLVAEAGTGVGKSLAYLIPGILQAKIEKRPLIVSTHTIALQDQLLKKDIPLVRAALSNHDQTKPFSQFQVAKLVGRNNYICNNRLHSLAHQTADLFLQSEESEIQRVRTWAAQTSTGLRDELTPQPSHEVWEWVSADSTLCNRKNCNPDNCHYQRAKRQLRSADVIIINHSLLFSLLAAGAGVQGEQTQGVLFPNDMLILDEAHTVAGVATDHFGLRLSSYAVSRCLRQIYHPQRKKGLLARYGLPRDSQVAEDAIAAAESFFSDIHYRYLTQKNIVRLTEPDWTDAAVLYAFDRLAQSLNSVANRHQDERSCEEILDYRAKVQSFRNTIATCLSLAEDDSVFWLERTGKRFPIVALRSAPLDVAEALRDQLFSASAPIIMTSATMATGDSLDSFIRQTGADSAESLILSSPFNFQEQMRVYVATDAPDMVPGSPLDSHYIADSIAWWAERCSGGTLVLFTSHNDLQRAARLLADQPSLDNRLVLCQGSGQSRQQLIAQFRRSGNAILLGTDSFWTGIDIAGTSLSQVIICRLPFTNPTHPVSQARSEKLRAQRRSPFMELTLPEAVLQFRQGIGRLIRNQNDRGNIVILDSRVLKKEYGKRFLASLPTSSWQCFDRKSRDQLIADWT